MTALRKMGLEHAGHFAPEEFSSVAVDIAIPSKKAGIVVVSQDAAMRTGQSGKNLHEDSGHMIFERRILAMKGWQTVPISSLEWLKAPVHEREELLHNALTSLGVDLPFSNQRNF